MNEREAPGEHEERPASRRLMRDPHARAGMGEERRIEGKGGRDGECDERVMVFE